MQAVLRRTLAQKPRWTLPRSYASTLGLRSFSVSLRRMSGPPQETFRVTPSKAMDGEGEDPRPPWVYVGTRLIYTFVIPLVGAYSILFYDFGEREHVFQPLRRWVFGLFNSAVALSPAEEKFVESAIANEKLESEATTSS